MVVLFDLFLNICLLRRGPQHVPDAEVLLRLCALVYVGLGALTLIFSWVQLDPLRSLIFALLDAMLLAGFAYLTLAQRRLLVRFRQTLTALFGANVLIGVAALPLSIWLRQEWLEQGSPQLPLLLSFVLLAWSLTVTGHILAEALSARRGVGVLYAFAYFSASSLLNALLLPQQGGAAA